MSSGLAKGTFNLPISFTHTYRIASASGSLWSDSLAIGGFRDWAVWVYDLSRGNFCYKRGDGYTSTTDNSFSYIAMGY